MSDLPPRLLTVEEAAEMLNVSVSWLRKRVAHRRVPFTKIGRMVRFSQSHIEEIIRAGEHQPDAQPLRRTRRGPRTRL